MGKEVIYSCSACGSTNIQELLHGFACLDCDPREKGYDEFEEY